MAKALRSPPTFATRANDDGTVSVLDVPVFAESVDARGKGQALVHGLERMRSWLAVAERRYAEVGYEAPLHVGHHGYTEVKGAGTFRPTKLVQRQIDGAQRWVMLAELRIRPEVYARVERGELLYRSVEIKPDASELLGLALLEHEAPFHKLELLRVSAAAEPALTYAEGVAVLTAQPIAFEEAPMDPETTPTEMSDTPPGDDDAPKMADGADPGAGAPPPWAAAMLAALEAIASKLGIVGDAPAAEVGPAEAPEATNLGMAEMHGELVALKRKIEAQERAVRLDAVERKLRDGGFGDEEVLVYRETVRSSGEAAGVGFVNGCLRVGGMTAAREPTSWLGSGEARTNGGQPGDAPEVLAYAEQPELLASARRLAANHALTQSQVPLADYLRFNLEV